MGIEKSPSVRVVLASESPRRRWLAGALNMPVETAGPGSDEGRPLPGETPAGFVMRLSAEKAEAVARLAGDAIVLGADTTVVLDGQVLGKPADRGEAIWMLRELRGRSHTVVTGVTALDGRSGRRLCGVKSTDVLMREYSDGEIQAYVDSGEPMDKAGAYAVQDGAFRPALETTGCYLNVVGLPLCEVVNMLEELGVRAGLRPDSHVADDCPRCPLARRTEVPAP